MPDPLNGAKLSLKQYIAQDHRVEPDMLRLKSLRTSTCHY